MLNNITEPFKAPEKPCLVDTGRGFSVSYQNRFLYSKYDPKKNIISLIDSLSILPGTLFVIASPLLWYGLKELVEKLPGNCFILAVEKDENLYELAKNELNKIQENSPSISQTVKLLPPEKIEFIVNIVSGTRIEDEYKIPEACNFRRAVLIEFSAGATLNKDLYKETALKAQNTIAAFWKNRLTLTKLGRLYSKNIFKNLSFFSNSISFRDIKRTITKPIFIFGAGESTVSTLKNIPAPLLKKSVILCVDAALPILKAFDIIPDAVIAVEGQLAIEKAYLGSKKINTLVFADMTSRNSVVRHFEAFSFFLSDFTKANFLESLKQLDFAPESIPPLGSVGLTAVYIAILLRNSPSIPVFCSGLDFSYSCGSTHGKNAPAHIARLLKTDRFNPVENYAASFKEGAFRTAITNENQYFSDTALSNYAKSFADQFSGVQNLYNCTDFGLNIGIPFASTQVISEYLQNISEKEFERPWFESLKAKAQEKDHSSIIKYLTSEEKALNRINELLMFGKDVESCSMSIEEELYQLISKREYLFLHFPDGYRCNTGDLSFLKRIRSETDFFLKDIKKVLQ